MAKHATQDPDVADQHGASYPQQAETKPACAAFGLDKTCQCDLLVVQHEYRQFLAAGQIGGRSAEVILRFVLLRVPRVFEGHGQWLLTSDA